MASSISLPLLPVILITPWSHLTCGHSRSTQFILRLPVARARGIAQGEMPPLFIVGPKTSDLSTTDHAHCDAGDRRCLPMNLRPHCSHYGSTAVASRANRGDAATF